MRIAMFYHSQISDWNHGNAHFLRGVAGELVARGHDVTVYAPSRGWSLSNLLREAGPEAVRRFHDRYPQLREEQYELDGLDLERLLDSVNLVIVHEWNAHELVRRIGEHHASRPDYRLLFHDTHHRSLTDRRSIADYDLRHYDGVLAFGEIIRDLYLAKGWAARAWVWHEAADTRVFHPIDNLPPLGQVAWVGNWGDDERTAELYEYLFEPVTREALTTNVYGVRYPLHQQAQLRRRGIVYRGWIENFRVPEIFARHAATVHIPRRPYVTALPGIPTIRPFEALACGIPLVCAPWEDSEGLFTPGKDYLVARNGKEMRRHMRDLINDPELSSELALHGHLTILRRHTCAHRVNELLGICRELGMSGQIHHRQTAGLRP
ncbi:MAG: glycosyltransferase [Aquisalimonadaceae bacterium]